MKHESIATQAFSGNHMWQQIMGVGLLSLGLAFASLAEARSEQPPAEPPEELLMNEDVNIITGLYTREYSLTGNGVVDYKTARKITLSEYNDYWNFVVETKEFPLFYWYAADHNGQFAMWVDPVGEGCSCNIVPYE